PASDHLRSCESAFRIALELFYPHRPRTIPNELDPVWRGPLIENLRVVRDENNLAFMIVGHILDRHQPRLYLTQGDEVVRFVDDDRSALGDLKMHDCVKADKGTLPVGQLV